MLQIGDVFLTEKEFIADSTGIVIPPGTSAEIRHIEEGKDKPFKIHFGLEGNEDWKWFSKDMIILYLLRIHPNGIGTSMENKTIAKVEVLHQFKVVARNYPAEMKADAIRLHFTDKTYTDIKVGNRGNFGVFSYFIEITDNQGGMIHV